MVTCVTLVAVTLGCSSIKQVSEETGNEWIVSKVEVDQKILHRNSVEIFFFLRIIFDFDQKQARDGDEWISFVKNKDLQKYQRTPLLQLHEVLMAGRRKGRKFGARCLRVSNFCLENVAPNIFYIEKLALDTWVKGVRGDSLLSSRYPS